MTLTHLDSQGRARMVDISGKQAGERLARASGRVITSASTLRKIRDNAIHKGDVLAVARVAGIQAAKKCQDLIPLCHQLPLSGVSIDFQLHDDGIISIEASCRTVAGTGVEMEALTAVSVAALTLYDMCKAEDKGIRISDIQLEEKLGGKSGHWLRTAPAPEEHA
jgi:cyclic pyranopterin phosphate synthase